MLRRLSNYSCNCKINPLSVFYVIKFWISNLFFIESVWMLLVVNFHLKCNIVNVDIINGYIELGVVYNGLVIIDGYLYLIWMFLIITFYRVVLNWYQEKYLFVNNLFYFIVFKVLKETSSWLLFFNVFKMVLA